jgi:hypothetical protein
MEEKTCKHEGCCKSHTGFCGGCHAAPELTAEEKDFLRLLAQAPFLPVCGFLLKSSRSAHFETVALEPVYLTDKRDSIETARKNAAILKRLAEYGAITLDYDIPLQNYDYSVFSESAAYQYFQDTVGEGRENPNFIFDTPALARGSLALTGLGQDLLDFSE